MLPLLLGEFLYFCMSVTWDGEFASCTSSHRKALIISSPSATFYFPSGVSVELGFIEMLEFWLRRLHALIEHRLLYSVVDLKRLLKESY